MVSRNEARRAHERLQLETPISDDPNSLKLQAEAAAIFVKQSVVIH